MGSSNLAPPTPLGTAGRARIARISAGQIRGSHKRVQIISLPTFLRNSIRLPRGQLAKLQDDGEAACCGPRERFRVVDLTLKDRRRAHGFLCFFKVSDRIFKDSERMHRAIALLALCASVQAFSVAPSGLSLRSYPKNFMVRLRMSPEFACSVNCALFCLCPLPCHRVEGDV
jgi:hypothetical protein